MENPITTNDNIVKLLKEISAVYQVIGENFFKVRAYQNAISIISSSSKQMRDIWQEGNLKDFPGLGNTIYSYLDELFKTGKVKHFEQAKANMPKGMFNLLDIPGIGPKTAFRLSKELDIQTKEDLIEQAKLGKIAKLSGFGAKSQEELLKSALSERQKKDRLLFVTALEIAEDYKKYIDSCPSVLDCRFLGSLRRGCATVGDIDFAVATANPELVINHFCGYKNVIKVEDKGEKKASVIISSGQRVDLMTGSPDFFGTILAHLTGSKLHNIALRTYALEKGCSLSEYGIKQKNNNHSFKSEEELYSFLGLSFIPPELREGVGEVESSKMGKLPKLVSLADIKGDLQLHTVLSDGTSSIEELAKKGKELGYEYIGITDHSPSLNTHSQEQVISIIERQKAIIDKLNCSKTFPRVFLGTEVNILASGELGISDNLLKMYDFAIAGIHSSFSQNRELTTKRIINAIKNPYINYIAHPTGRILLERPPLDIDWSLIFGYCVEYNKFLEINSFPSRLDLPDDLVRKALDRGIGLLINTDSHAVLHMDYMKYGVTVARRGWCSKEAIINTLPLNDFIKTFKIRTYDN